MHYSRLETIIYIFGYSLKKIKKDFYLQKIKKDIYRIRQRLETDIYIYIYMAFVNKLFFIIYMCVYIYLFIYFHIYFRKVEYQNSGDDDLEN